MKKNAGESADIYNQAFQMGESEPFHYFTAACAWTKLGKNVTALQYLVKAIDKGWTDILHEDLVPLREYLGWEKIIKRIESKRTILD